MNTTNDATQELVREFFTYSPDTGKFFRIKCIEHRRRDMVGKESGCLNIATGYVSMSVGGAKQYAHRLAWIYMFGAIPIGTWVDHVNGNRSDNRICNLRLASHSENLRNCKTRVDNTSGIKGVSFDRFRVQWAAAIGKKKLGRFDTLFDAACARKSAALRAFGEFARE